MNKSISQRSILHVYAHPDDESFGNPATIMLYANQGVRMGLLTFTRGEAGLTNGVCQPDELGDVREKELKDACHVLGIKDLTLWNYPDGGLKFVEELEILPRIEKFIRNFSPDVVVTYGEDGVTGHPDHIAVGGWVTTAFHRQVRKYPGVAPKRLYHRISPLKRRTLYNRSDLVYRNDYTTIVDGRNFPHARLTAHECHRSQKQATDYTQPKTFEAGLVDYYVRQYPEWRGGPIEADLFGDSHHSDETKLP
ncbi:MAG: PIG-L family deacetylase [Nitrospinae bacterium]|nr:PIG-L family deacetylase [Nitrospinota bacterium]